MLSKSTKHNPNYLCKIVEIKNLRKHKNADRLLVFTVDGNDIITSNETKEGTIGVYFPLECQISTDYLKANNEYKTKELNSDVNAPTGFFEEKGRVKALRLRQEKSMGYVAPISTFQYLLGDKYTDLSKHIGEEFDTLNGHEIVKKYVVKQQGGGLTKQQNKKVRESKIIENQFRLHYDTAQLAKNLHRLDPESIISISWKLHGTSFVSSKVLCKRPLKWYEKVLQSIGVKIDNAEYSGVYSSRKVIKNEDINTNPSHYYKYDLWKDIHKQFEANLLDGESIYGECVGYTADGGAIQKGYDYGCKPGENKVYIYRITHTNPSGKVIDLPYNMVMERAEQLGVEACPFIYFGPASAYYGNDVFTPGELGDNSPIFAGKKPTELWREEFLNVLKQEYVHDQNCQFCTNKVPAEGIVLRIEGLKAEALKLKAFAFLERETKELDKGEVNIEDAQSNEEDDSTAQ